MVWYKFYLKHSSFYFDAYGRTSYTTNLGHYLPWYNDIDGSRNDAEPVEVLKQ